MLVALWGAFAVQAQAEAVSIARFEPSVGYRGSSVLIEGSGFTDVTGVRFGTVDAEFTVESSSIVHAVVPAGAATGPLTVEALQGSATSPSDFTAQADVVLILTDDQRWDALEMPTLQAEVIAKGVTFSQAFAPNPVCCPSRASILTGRFSHSTDVWKNRPPHGGFETFADAGVDASTFATWLDSVGYTTALIGKYMNGYGIGDTAHVPPGWDRWVALSLASATGGDKGGYYRYSVSVDGVEVSYGSEQADYSTDVLARYAADFVAGAPPDKPLLLVFAPRAPHDPTTAASRHTSAFRQLAPLDSPNINESDVSDKPSYVQAFPTLTSTQISKLQNLRRRHYRTLLAVDEALATIIDELRVSGRLQDAMIIYMSDNGFAFGEHRWFSKEVPYEVSIRVPLVVRYDALTGSASTTMDQMALNVDVAPTLAEAAGVPATGADGSSLLGLIDGTQTGWRDEVLLEHARTSVEGVTVPAYCGVRSASWKYVRYSNGEEELYDLALDPFELQNLASSSDHAELKAALLDRTRELCFPRPPKYGPF